MVYGTDGCVLGVSGGVCCCEPAPVPPAGGIAWFVPLVVPVLGVVVLGA
jgi:hypothetical protein